MLLILSVRNVLSRKHRVIDYLYAIFLLFTLLMSNAHANTVSTRTIHHAMGKTTIHGQPIRVVSLMQGATDTLVALGIKPVGAVESWSEKPMYQYLRPYLPQLHYVGLETQPSLEDIARLKPDLIIASKFRNEKTYKILSQIAPTLMLTEVYEFKDTLKIVGQAVAKEHQANILLQQWNQRIKNTQTQLKHHYAGDWPQQISLLEIRDDHLRAYSHHSFSGQILSELGFSWSKVSYNQNWALQKLASKESIPLLDADIFFIFMRNSPTTKQNFIAWKTNSLWKQLRASQKKQIYLVNTVNWNLTGGILGANRVLDEVNQIFKIKEIRQ
jgi:iron complex transport system substrate-binding protein